MILGIACAAPGPMRDTSDTTVGRLLASPAVEDTHGIDRATGMVSGVPDDNPCVR